MSGTNEWEDDVQVVQITNGLTELADQIVKQDDRRTFIGGSDAPVILGLVSWKTRYELYLEKRGEKEPDDLSDVERVQWGIVLEDVIAQMYTRKTGKKVRRVNSRIFDKKNIGFPRAAQIDRRIVGGGILEIKTTDASQAAEWGPEGSAEVPPGYYAQVQHQIDTADENNAEIAVLIGGNRLRIYNIPRDDEFIAYLRKAEEAFWNCVVKGIPPEPITVEEASLMWPTAPKGNVIGTMEDVRIATQLIHVKEEIKKLEEEADALELKLKESIKDIGDTLVVNGVPIATWKTQVSRRLDSKALEAAHPEIAEAFKRNIESRVFRPLKAALTVKEDING